MFHVPLVIEHYEYFHDKVEEVAEINTNECFICLELHTNNNDTPINWKTQRIYIRLCECGGWVHVQCVNKWYVGNNKCPICRKYMYVFDSKWFSFVAYINNNNIFNMYLCICFCLRVWKSTLFLFMTTFYIYCIYAMFFNMPSTDYRILNNDEINDINNDDIYYDNENFIWYPLDINDTEL